MKNILFILMDQLRADYVGCYGAKHLYTPNIDRLADEGIRYERAISPSPLCVPARASLMTGKSSLANRVTENSSWLRPDHEEMGIDTWPKKLTNAGFYTMAIGKMHFYPWDINEGFLGRIIAEDKRHINLKDDYTNYLMENGLRRLHGEEHEGYKENLGAIINKIPSEHQIDKFVANETVEFINQYKEDKPFALMVGFPGPHCPYDPSKDMLDDVPEVEVPLSIPKTKDSESFREMNIASYKNDWANLDYSNFEETKKQKIRKYYSAVMQRIDKHIGDIIQALEDKSLYENTIIIISSDHGDLLGDYDLIGKHYFYEPSIRVPLVIRHPDYKSEVIKENVSLTDINATLLHFANLKNIDTNDSTVLFPFGNSEKRAEIFGATDIGHMIIKDKLKYCLYYNGTEELYDLAIDNIEQSNLINEESYQVQISELRKLMFKRQLEAIAEGNIDNKVMTQPMDEGFYEENWERPYPFK